MKIIFWFLDKVLDAADFLARIIPQMKYSGHSDHFTHPLDTEDELPEQGRLWD